MELSQLRYVAAVADTGNFTRAAARSSVAQPSLSQQIIKLEKELGHKLFHRMGRKAVLTEAGIVFLERARRILFEVEGATKQLEDHPSLERKITVGAIQTLAPFIFPTLITRCRKRFPNLQVNIREDFKITLLREMLEGELDLAIVARPVADPNIQVEALWREPLILVVPKGHPLASKQRVIGADLADETFILLGSSSSLAAQVRRFCGENNFEPRIGSRCAQIATVKALVGIGAGISILPRGARSAEDADSLVYITLADAEPVREIVVLRHMQRYQTRGAEQFLSLVREGFAEPVAPAAS
ncbi:MAG TPA: LysR substrate-binding domain-containing protein [Opitutaceae bacterium]|nr:LysR substrate-binding domain-containing protein [Opitutaceae bacterium]